MALTTQETQALVNENSELKELVLQKDKEIYSLQKDIIDLKEEIEDKESEIDDLEEEMVDLENENNKLLPLEYFIPENIDHQSKLELLEDLDVLNNFNWFQLKERLTK
jgi:chromosome segregation ATPase